MENYLVDHALKNVWCSPRQDGQLMVEPKRISPHRGSLNSATIMESTVELPVKKRYVHLFQFGQIDPQMLGLLRQVPYWTTSKWFKFSDAMNAANLEVTIYTGSGILLPRTDSYYMFTEEMALVFAVPDQPSFKLNLAGVPLYFRFYQNHFFKTNTTKPKQIVCGSASPKSDQEILNLENSLAVYDSKPGWLKVFKNGLLVSKAQLGDIKYGDYIEWVYDSSIKTVVEWRLSELHQFRSELDNTYKYLLHYKGDNTDTIDFQDDVDFFVVFKPRNGFVRGVYVNRNMERFHRMVTHRDYSLDTTPVVLLKDLLAEHLGIVTPDAEFIYVRAHIREGGNRRALVYDNNRIFELYKLSEEDRYRAMIGIDATVPEWNCANLEKCAYTEIMRGHYLDVTPEKVQEAYGYNASAKILGDSPLRTSMIGTQPNVRLPYGAAKNSVIYEYDSGGRFLGYHYHENDDDYDTRDLNCRMIECISGKLSNTFGSISGQTHIPEPQGCSYRVYYKIVDQLYDPEIEWTDITSSNLIEVVDGFIEWRGGDINQWIKVRTDENVVAYDHSVRINDGLINFTLMENPTGNPLDEMQPLDIPPGHFDIWMNGKALVEGPDYMVRFPVVYITSTPHLNYPLETSDQNFHVRMYGLKVPDPIYDDRGERGWVYNGALSNNGRFDLRDDRVLHIAVGGRVFHRDQVRFEEDSPAPAILHQLNGMPYKIRDIIVPMRNHLPGDTYDLRTKSQEIDQRVSAYLTMKKGDMRLTDPSAIVARYPVVSLFLSYLTALLVKKAFMVPQDRGLDVNECLQLTENFNWLLNIEHYVQPDFSSRFSHIVPHPYREPVALGPMEYLFVQTLSEVLLRGGFKMTEHYVIV